jgi:hypothetical protein
VLFEVLKKHGIFNRVLSVTTNNALNNKTLITSIKDIIEPLQSQRDITIIQVPCIAHVIQLSLKDLLENMKAVLSNDIAEQVWSDKQLDNLRARQRKRDITNILNKV